MNAKQISELFEINKTEFDLCLEPRMTCKNKSIRAHSVQNSRILDNLVQDGHVMGFRSTTDPNSGVHVAISRIGRNNAMTFKGLCSEHDQNIFRPIDTDIICLNNDCHLFLIAYRAVLREVHASMVCAYKLQLSINSHIDEYLKPENYMSPPYINAMDRLMAAYDTCNFKATFDNAFLEKDYSFVNHIVLNVETKLPTIAVSALFSIDEVAVGDDVLRAILNVIPISKTETKIVFSFRKNETELVKLALSKYLNSTGFQQLYEISRLILNNCENFVFSPFYVQQWSNNKLSTIEKYYSNTIVKSDMEFESKELFLF